MKKILFSVTLTLFVCAFANCLRAQYINTVAGTGIAGYTGDLSPAASAHLNGPFGIAVNNATGDVYFADSANNCVRMVSGVTGIITTVAGTGIAGTTGDNGPATAARLSSPVGVALDASGNIYISDIGSSRIRMVTVATGIINTVAGNGTAGYLADGVAATATRLNRPYAVAFDAAGNFYIADWGNHRVRKVTIATGIISTFAGNGTGGYISDGVAATATRIKNPDGLAFDAAGDLYIADYGNNRVRMVNTSGIINTVAGNGTSAYAGDGSVATATGINRPVGIAFDATGNFYVTDSLHQSVRMITVATGLMSTFAGTGVAGYNGDCIAPTTAQLNVPTGLAFDGSGSLYITDKNNNRIRKVSPPCSGTPSAGIAMSTAYDGCVSYTPTLFLSGASTGCDISYQWESYNGAAFTAIPGATNATYSPTISGASNFDCIVTCNGSGFSATSAPVFIVVSSPVVVSPINYANNTVCPGDTIMVSDTSSNATWSATNLNATVDASGIVTGFTPGLDTILYSVNNGCGTFSTSLTVTVNPIVTPGVVISLSSASTSVCTGTPVIYSGIPTNGGLSPAYTWYVNGLFSGVGSSLTYTPINGDVIMCTITTNAPCATTLTSSASVAMTVIPIVTPSISITDSAYGDSVCTGSLITYYSNITNGGLSPSFDWAVNGTVLVSGPGSTFTFTPLPGDVITAQLSSSLACAVSVSDTINMTVTSSQTPVISISAFPGDTTCPGYAVTYTASTVYGGITPTFLWKKNGIPVATGSTYVHIPATGDTIQCALYSSSPCRTSDSVFSNVIHMVVRPLTLATIAAAAHPGTTIAAGQADTLVAAGANIGSTSLYQWYINGVAIAGATSSIYVSDSFANNDSVFCIVHNGNPCAAPSVLNTNVLRISILGAGLQDIAGTGFDIRLIPNPTTGKLIVEGSLSTGEQTASIQITNLLGRVVGSYTAPVLNGKLKKQIDLGDGLTNGIYILHVITDAGHQVSRFTLDR